MISPGGAALLVGATVAAFALSILVPFHLDDFALLVDPSITSPSGWWQVWRFEQSRPLTWFSFWLNYQFSGADPRPWHAFNLALHILTVLLVRGALGRLLPWRAAVIGAFFFALHPIQTEAVVYIYARATLLAAMLCAASLHCWLAGRRLGAVAFFAAALLAKEECAAFPVFLYLLNRTLLNRNLLNRILPAGKEGGRHIAAMLGLALLAVSRVAYLAAVTPGSGAGAGSGVAPFDYLAAQGTAILRYLSLLAIPLGFSIESPLSTAADWKAAAAWLLLGLAAMAALRRIGRGQEGFWFIAGLILLAPTSSVFPAADLSADRRMYLPMLAFSAMAGLILQRTQYPILLAAAAIVYGMLDHVRVQTWRDPQSLWAEAARAAPGKTRPVVQLARLITPLQALPLLEEAKTNAPDDAGLASELGRVYLELGQAGDALREFGRAVALKPGDAPAYNNRGTALLALGMRERAVEDFRRAAELDPCLDQAHANLRQAGLSSRPPERCR